MLFQISDLHYINGSYRLENIIKKSKKYAIYTTEIQLNSKTYQGMVKLYSDKTGFLLSITDPLKEQEVLSYYVQQIDAFEHPDFVKLLILRYIFHTIRYFCLIGYFIQMFNMALYTWYMILYHFSYLRYFTLFVIDFILFSSLLYCKQFMRRI